MTLRKPRWAVMLTISDTDSLQVDVAEERWEITPSGALEFWTDGVKRRAYAPGQWLSVEPLP